MATFSIENIELKGVTCCVPSQIENNYDLDMSTQDIEKLIKSTGIKQRRIATEDVCTSDLSVEAAEDLIKNLEWNKNDIEILVFVSQTPDYVLPVTSTIIQDKLSLPKSTIAFDVPLGCSGYTYGLSIIASMMKSIGLKKGLLLAGDTISKMVSKKDKSTLPLFGDASSATALEFDASSEGIKFDLGSDGSGADSIIVKDGGYRNVINSKSFEMESISDGIERNSNQLVLNGMDVFSFGISQAPRTVNKLLKKFEIDKDLIDYFIFHQANMMMNKFIEKKLKLSSERVLYSLGEFGNTSSASIPITLVSHLNKQPILKDTNLLLCGFGVGLSWGTAQLNIKKDFKYSLIEK